MARTMQIQISLGGGPAASQGLGQLANQMNRLAQAQQRLVQGSQGVVRAQQQVARQVQGPALRLLAAGGQLPAGINAQQFDQQYRRFTAEQGLQRAMARMQGPSLGKSLLDAVMTSRIGLGAGGIQVMPLVNRLMPLLARLPGPVGALGAAALVTVGAVQALGAAAEDSARLMGEIRAAGLISGAHTGNVAALRAMGMSPSDIPGLSRGLVSRISSDPLAMAAAASLGVGPMPGRPFGPKNEAAVTQTIIFRLSRLANANERLVKARMMELDHLLPLIEATRRHSDLMAHDMAITEKLNSAQAQRQASDHSFAEQRNRQAGENLRTGLGQVFQPFSTFRHHSEADIKNLLALGFANLGKKLWAGWLPDPDKLAKMQGAQIDALNRNTAALQGLGQYRPGLYGGGPHARGAVPGALRQQMLSQALAGNALRAGAFSLF